MVERRRARRYALNLEIMEVNGKSAPGARILELSTNGTKLELPFSPPLYDPVTLVFLLPGFNKPSKLVGRVVWKRPPNSQGLHVIGLQFYQNYWELDQWLRQQSLKPT